MQIIQKEESLTESDFTFCVCTFNSSKTLSRCLASIRKIAKSEILVVDHHSRDSTIELAKAFGAKIILESTGLGHARQLCLDNASSKYVVFVDSDVEIKRSDFLTEAAKALQVETTGAVVGVSAEHKIGYGLPASLLVLRKSDFLGRVFPDYIDARETFFIQERLDKRKLKTVYIPRAMIHRSEYRRYKPEWEGANTRLLPSSLIVQLVFASKVIFLLTLNSKSLKNFVYLPIFYAKFLRGFLIPDPWLRLRRVEDSTH
jgi:glycosyltransferase involved in cell wall biosynthesis